jgi:hypothetical protein
MSELKTPSAAAVAAASSLMNADNSLSSPAIVVPASNEEEVLRRQLRTALKRMTKREPLEPSYKKLLQRTILTRQPATIQGHRITIERTNGSVFSWNARKGSLWSDHATQTIGRRRHESSLYTTWSQSPWTKTIAGSHFGRHGHASGTETQFGWYGSILTTTKRNEKAVKATQLLLSSSAANQTEVALRQAELEHQQEAERQWEEATVECNV